MLVLALDTALETCSAALVENGRILATRSEPMARGHQERLAPLVKELIAEAGVAFSEIDRVGVTVGPGSFTGLRVGLAFAKGLGFALGRPVVGIGTLEAIAASAPPRGMTAVILDARRDQVYLQTFRDGAPTSQPEALSAKAAAELLNNIDQSENWSLIGSGAPLVAPYLTGPSVTSRSVTDPIVLAALAAAAPEPAGPPSPLYLRAPDAKLPA